MSICRFTNPSGCAEYALYRDNHLCPLSKLMDAVPQAGELFDKDARWFDSIPEPKTDDWQPVDVLLPPVPPPEKVICIGLNYRDHAIETGADIPTEPVVFSKFNTALIGHSEAIQIPPNATQVDYEAELVVVIGRGGKNIRLASAMEHVFGYTCGHDVSARDWQKGRPGGQWLLGKSFDTFGPIGPCIVPKHKIPDPSNVRVRMILNGETVQDSTTAQLIFDIPTLIAHLSTIMTLSPGDLIFTGTPPGVGAARNPPRFLRAGDCCTVQIDHIGSLTNPCA
jgi:2-keto-4-pentenoate hydratase/2-oxohepta-3-ene-1,7-dioic acid hydratase in catechol pathway